MPLVALISASFQQSISTEDANKSIKRCLGYLITFPNGNITCTAFDMVLWEHSDGTCLAEDESISIVGGH